MDHRLKSSRAQRAREAMGEHARITLSWDHRAKKWDVLGINALGTVVHRSRADSSVAMDSVTLRELVSSVQDRLEALLF
uniref:Uncharacterized protein n=1 Tax=uncultured prokaryote TaxID=198431 RepID=A0A0H5Q3X2_9ZZZZ|nr:hypothetical protein [uncultured prokaryote]